MTAAREDVIERTVKPHGKERYHMVTMITTWFATFQSDEGA
jgi:hypothetical protein